jgi:multisubunit Na+/H+ antiporter MnhB subunit
MVEVFVTMLIVLMIVGALIAIETPVMLHSVISLGVIGFLLSIVFLFLAAPDLAITQIAVEVVTLVLLLKATRGSHQEQDVMTPWSAQKLATAFMLILLVVLAAPVLRELPAFGVPVMDRFPDAPSNAYLREGLAATGSANIVTAVLLDFRGYDTLGEATVLFCAALGALTVLRRDRNKSTASSDLVEEP